MWLLRYISALNIFFFFTIYYFFYIFFTIFFSFVSIQLFPDFQFSLIIFWFPYEVSVDF